MSKNLSVDEALLGAKVVVDEEKREDAMLSLLSRILGEDEWERRRHMHLRPEKRKDEVVYRRGPGKIRDNVELLQDEPKATAFYRNLVLWQWTEGFRSEVDESGEEWGEENVSEAVRIPRRGPGGKYYYSQHIPSLPLEKIVNLLGVKDLVYALWGIREESGELTATKMERHVPHRIRKLMGKVTKVVWEWHGMIESYLDDHGWRVSQSGPADAMMSAVNSGDLKEVCHLLMVWKTCREGRITLDRTE